MKFKFNHLFYKKISFYFVLALLCCAIYGTTGINGKISGFLSWSFLLLMIYEMITELFTRND